MPDGHTPVACMDSRCNPYDVLGFKIYEIISLRNPGGRIFPFLTQLAAMDAFFGLHQIIILQHSNCGASHITIDHERQDIKTKCPGLTEAELEKVIDESPLKKDNDDSLKLDLEQLRACKFIRNDLKNNSVGFYLDVKTGIVEAQ